MHPSRLLLLAALWLPTASIAQSRPKATGLTGTYYAGRNFDQKKFTRIDPSIDFRWHNPPGPGLDWQFYSVRWVGRLFAPVTGRYRFSVEVDDGVRVWVGGRQIINAWDLHDNDVFEGSIDLIANRFYDLRIDYFNDILEGEIKLYWTKPDEVKQTGPFSDAPRRIIEPGYLGREPIRLAPPKPVASVPKPTTTAARPATRPTPTTTATAQRTTRTPPVQSVRRTPTLPTAETATATPAAPVFGRLTAGEAVVLRNVFFEQSDYRLLPASYAELDKLVRTLQQQPALRIEIAGHTDNQGDPRLNMALSENRAKVVTNYLIRHGIAEDRLDAKGYGGTRPLTDNASESARAQNRRVEFVVK